MQKKWGAIAAAGAASLVVLFLLLMMLGQETVRPAAPAATTAPTRPAEPIVVQVDDRSIAVDAWVEAVRLDQVMSQLAGVAAPDAKETLERMINELLLLRALPQERPGAREVDAYLAALQSQWGASDEQVEAALQAAGLQPADLEQTLERLLMVRRAQEALQAQGVVWESWIAQRRAQADIVYYPERIEVVERTLMSSPAATATAAVVDAPSPVPLLTVPPLTIAPDFALDRVGGGQLTLSEQLAQGPVVLVFFQRCG